MDDTQQGRMPHIRITINCAPQLEPPWEWRAELHSQWVTLDAIAGWETRLARERVWRGHRVQELPGLSFEGRAPDLEAAEDAATHHADLLARTLPPVYLTGPASPTTAMLMAAALLTLAWVLSFGLLPRS